MREKADLLRAKLDAADVQVLYFEGRPQSLETTSLHLDALADLKRIHSHICSVAYPVLEAAGELPALGAAKDDMAADAVEFRPEVAVTHVVMAEHCPLKVISANGMVRPCSCPVSDRSWQGAPKTRSTLCLTISTT